MRAMLEECTQYTTQPSTWQNAGVTAIHGGSIVTNSITAQQMAADSITSNKIATGAVAAKHIAVGSIGADHIATRSLTSDKLNVNSLSAISSDIGRITAGSITGTSISGNNINGNNISGGSITGTTITGTNINGNNINGNNISGGTITGTTISGTTVNGGSVRGSVIEGGTIRGARLEGVTGKFTGALEVNQLIGGNLCEVFVANVNISKIGSENDEVTFCSTTLHINPSPVKRIVFIVNSDVSFIVNANEKKDYYYSKTSRGGYPPEIFNFGGGNPKICVTAYAVSDTRTIYQ